MFGCASDVNICYREGRWQLGLHLINVLSQVWQPVFPVAEIPENFADPVDQPVAIFYRTRLRCFEFDVSDFRRPESEFGDRGSR